MSWLAPGPDLDFGDAVRIVGEAPFSPSGWNGALEVMMRTAGGWCGQLLGVSRTAGIQLHHTFNISEDLHALFEGMGGADPLINPRAAILNAPMLRVMTDDDFASQDIRRRNSFYRDYLDVADAPYICTARIPARGDLGLVVAGMRHASAGHVQLSEVRMFEALLPHLGAAVRLRMALEDEAAAIAAGALDTVRIPAFLLDAWGRVLSCTASGEATLAAADTLRVRRGKLEAVDPECDTRLQVAITLACLRDPAPGAAPRGRAVPLRAGGRISMAEVSPLLGSQGALRLGAVAVVALPQVPRPAAAEVLTLLGLTLAEAAIARALVEGQRPQEIADSRAVSVTTIRTQVRAIYAKLEVSSIAGLAGKLQGLG